MVLLSRIYTKSGDRGKTALGDGSRVSKAGKRVEAIGQVDEINAVIGLARLHTKDSVNDDLGHIQNDLFDIGADLCMPDLSATDCLRITSSQVEWLEKKIDTMNTELKPLHSFVLPGGTEPAAFLHLARVVTRRAERAVVELSGKEPLRPEIIQYINRLSDYLFVLSRYLNDKGDKDVLWKPGEHR
jgi:cob(I)alamin adenosyltransferase